MRGDPTALAMVPCGRLLCRALLGLAAVSSLVLAVGTGTAAVPPTGALVLASNLGIYV